MDRGRIFPSPRLFFVLFLLLPFTFLLAPTLMAEGGEEGNPVKTVPVTMNFQPPLNANSLNEFLPPGVILRPITTTIPTTPTIPSGTVTPYGTVTPPPSSTTVLPTVTTPGGTLTSPLMTPNSPEGVTPFGLPVSVMPITYTTPVLFEEDAVSFLDNQVAVVVETDTFAGDTFLEFTPLEASPLPFTTTQSISTTQSYPLLRFHLEAIDATSGQPQTQFPHPARLVLDLRQLTEAYDLSAYRFYLAYQDETDPNRWIEAPILVHQPGGLISVELTHFSNWAAGVRPERWNPAWNPPTVSEFSGAVTYSYPIEVPPGRHGMQPGIALSYSSAGLNGRIYYSDPGVVADGWSLAEISVVRVGVKTEVQSTSNGDEIVLIHPDKFRLVLNGNGHELLPDSSANTTTDPVVRYYAKDAPSVRVYRYFDIGAQNTERIFWLVDTGDGTRYRLGYYSEAEEWQKTGANWQIQISGHPGLTISNGGPDVSTRTSAIAWHVDTITDSFGNQMQYHYHTSEGTETIRRSGTNTDLNQTTQENRIFEIRYNYPVRYSGSQPAPWNVQRPGDISGNTPATLIQFRAPNDQQSTYATWPITSIYIYHGNLTTPMVEYRLTAETHVNYALGGSSGCKEIDYNVMQGSHTRVVTAIQQWVDTDADPATSDEGYTLPATTFSYTVLPNFHRNGWECFRFEYMSGFSNGYGGSVSFLYDHDGDGDDNRGRAIGSYIWYGPLANVVPEIGYSYHVEQTTVSDGRNSPVVTTYSFASPCYGQLDNNVSGNWGGMPGATLCNAGPNGDSPQYSGVTGFEDVTITLKNYQGNPVSVRKVHSYVHPYPLVGKTSWTKLYKADGATLMQTVGTAYETIAVGPTTFYPVDYQATQNYSNGESSASMSSRVEYDYDAAAQGNAQYGNVTQIRAYSDAYSSTPYRVTKNIYYPNTTTWIVNKPGITALYQGDGTTLVNATYLTYNTQGAVTRSAQARPINCSQIPGGPVGGCVYARETIEQTSAYDAYGNPTSTQTYSDYGYRQYDSNWTLLGSGTIYPSQAQDTTIAYENDYNLYPISVSNDLEHTTTFQIYGFNGVGLGGFQLQRGLLKAVVNPNGTETRYEYDPFGRLHAVFDNESFTGFGDETQFNGNPVVLYRYWDNTWNHDTVTWLNPAGNQPFAISEHNRHGTFNGQNGQFMFKTFTYFDGLGRPIQSQNRGVSIHGAGVQDVVTVTNYNAQGLATCTSAPFAKTHVPNSHDPGFSTTACTSVDRTTTAYDDLGRTTSVTPPSGNATTYSYEITDIVTVDSYNKLSLTRTYDPKGYMTSQFTNSLGQLVLVRDYTGTDPQLDPYVSYSDTRYTYDLMGNLTHVKTSDANNSQPSSFLRTVIMNYNNFGRKIGMNDPDMGNWSYVYDAMGNLTRQTDQKGQVLCFYYDSLNRITRKIEDSTTENECPTYANAPSSGAYHLASYRYDTDSTITSPYAVGQLVEVKWGSTPTSNKDLFHYDSRGRLDSQTRTIDGLAFTMTTLTWDVLSRPLTVRTPHWFVSGQSSGYEVITLTYDHEGENTLEADNVASQSDLVTDVLYNVRGQMTGLVRGGFTTSYSYFPSSGNSGTGNNDYRLSLIAHGAAYDNLPNFSYTYDKAGNILSQTNQLTSGTSDSQSFGYDHLHRLTSASGSGNISGVSNYSHSYAYSGDDGKLGNMTSYAGSTYDYSNWSEKCETFPTQAMPHAVRQAGYDWFCYDDNGNMTVRQVGEVKSTQTFDVENRLIEVVSDVDTTVTTFAYDTAGQRTKTVVEIPGDEKTITYYPFPNYEEEVRYEWQFCAPCADGGVWLWVETATIKRSTYSLAGQAIATRITGDPNANNNDLFYFLTDHLGSTTLMTNSSGTPQSSTVAYHLPFGAYRNTTPPSTDLTERGFTGHRENRDIGLTYMNARFYVVGVGRFLTADTIVPDPGNPQAYNRYSYVRGNPLYYTDPSGHCEENGDESCWSAAEQLSLNTGMPLSYFSFMSYEMLMRDSGSYAKVLAFTLMQLGNVDRGVTTDLQAMFDIIDYALINTEGDVPAAFELLASVFYRPDYHNDWKVKAGTLGHHENIYGQYNYKDYTNRVFGKAITFGESGFDNILTAGGGGNQVEHFIGAAALTAFTGGESAVGSLLNIGREAWDTIQDGGPINEADVNTGNVAAYYVDLIVNVDEGPYRVYEQTIWSNRMVSTMGDNLIVHPTMLK